MKRLAWLAIVSAFFCGTASAGQTSGLVAQLVTDVCIPVMQSARFDPSRLPLGGRPLTSAEMAQDQIEKDIGAWRYESDDDFVVLEVRTDGCDVVTDHTGGPAFLAVLEQTVADRYGAPKTVMDQPHPSNAILRTRGYLVSLPPGAAPDSPTAEALAVTYATEAAPAGKKMFYVGVLALTKAN